MAEWSMSKTDRDAFLAKTHVGVFSVTDEDGRAPLTIPVWYRYEPGGPIVFVTDGNSKKVRLLGKTGRASFLVQSETPPYRYVTVEGPVSVERSFDWKREVDDVAIRYLGAEMGKRYLEVTKEMYAAMDNVLVVIRPERWASADLGALLPG